jgi:hypothetical protein
MAESVTSNYIGMRRMGLGAWIGKSKKDIEQPKMKKKPSRTSVKKFALCLQNEGNLASLEVFKVYRVLPPHPRDDPQDIRIVDESGEDYLYPRANFLLIQLPKRALELANAQP